MDEKKILLEIDKTQYNYWYQEGFLDGYKKALKRKKG